MKESRSAMLWVAYRTTAPTLLVPSRTFRTFTDVYVSVQTFKNPKPALMAILRESGPVPGDENGVKSKRGDEGSKKKKRIDKNVRFPAHGYFRVFIFVTSFTCS